MPVYHSSYNSQANDFQQSCAVPLLPLRTSVRGPAPKMMEGEETDIIDETLTFFRANMFFSTFDVKGGADRLLIYLTLYANQCIKRVAKVATKAEGGKALFSLANEPFPLPGDSGWKLGGFFSAPGSKKESDTMRAYLKQAREELSKRIVDRLYGEDGARNKWWMQYARRDFMNIKTH